MPRKKTMPKLIDLELSIDLDIDLSLEPHPMVQNECLICLSESKTNLINTKNEIFRFSENDIYIIKCECNVNVHKDCMMLWTQTKRACPICLKPFTQLSVVNFNKSLYFDIEEYAKLLCRTFVYIIVIIVGYKIFML
jgi:hypothetical protein